MSVAPNTLVRRDFLVAVLGENSGWLCIAYAPLGQKRPETEWFEWPQAMKRVDTFIERHKANHHMWFCPVLFHVRRRKKEHVISESSVVWADLDNADPEQLIPRPPVIVESSPNRYQAYWPLENNVPSYVAEEYSKRVARLYKNLGVDQSGWDLGQLLRIPFTYNYKYPESPEVDILSLNPTRVPVGFFEDMPPSGSSIYLGEGITGQPLPPLEEVPDPETVFDKFARRLGEDFYELFNRELDAEDDWSRVLWRLMNMGFEIGMNPREVFSIAQSAKCNKWLRDHNEYADQRLWQDVQRALLNSKQKAELTNKAVIQIPVELESAAQESGYRSEFVDRYVGWATAQSDAPEQYHEALAFVMLSATLAGVLRIPAPMGDLVPNLWLMILADTTLTRKTTAMNMAMDILEEMDDDVVVATDGSVEGLMGAMQTRPKRASVFWRDEFTGFIEAVKKKDWMAGMLESLTKMYDGRGFKRTLKKETIRVDDPIFILVAGGIKTKMNQILDEEHVTSGFVPRFIVVSAEAEISKLRPFLSAMSNPMRHARDAIKMDLRRIRDKYPPQATISLNSGGSALKFITHSIEYTDDARDRYNIIEHSMVMSGHSSRNPTMYTPVLDRASKTLLKMAALVAAADPNGSGKIETKHINYAAKYIHKWLPHMIELLENVGISDDERLAQAILSFLRDGHDGVSLTHLHRSYKVGAAELRKILTTLEARGLIYVKKKGSGMNVFLER